MGLPEWLTIPAAPAAECSRAVDAMEPRRIRHLCFIADPILAERCRRASAVVFDLDLWASVARYEFVDPGSLSPFAPHAGGPLDRHRLDVALSMGRHAAERAKLAGYRMLVCMAVAEDSGLDDWFPLDTAGRTVTTPSEYPRFARCDNEVSSQVAYARLRQIARFEIAALTGALIACAQMGIQFHPRGCLASIATQIALDLNPAVRDWFLPSNQTRYNFLTALRPCESDPCSSIPSSLAS